MIKFEKKISINIQFEPAQLKWLSQRAEERADEERRRVSVSELVREFVQEKIIEKD